MRLQADEVWRYRLAPVRVVIYKIGLLLPVEENSEVVVLDTNLELVPLARTLRHDALVEVLGGDVVNRAGGTEFLVHVLAGGWVAAP